MCNFSQSAICSVCAEASKLSYQPAGAVPARQSTTEMQPYAVGIRYASSCLCTVAPLTP